MLRLFCSSRGNISSHVRFYSSKPLIQFNNAQVHRFGVKEPAFKNLSFHLNQDQRLVIVGPVSAGKTTLAEVKKKKHDLLIIRFKNTHGLCRPSQVNIKFNLFLLQNGLLSIQTYPLMHRIMFIWFLLKKTQVLFLMQIIIIRNVSISGKENKKEKKHVEFTVLKK